MLSNPAVAQRAHRPPDVVGSRAPLEHLEQVRLEALGAERDARHAVLAEERGELGRHRLRVRLDRHLVGRGQRAEEALELVEAP